MKNMVLTKINAYRYIDSVRDGNKIHQSDVDARGYGLPEAIVPGMWLASHIQGRASISSISQIKFSGKVFYNEDVTINELPNVIGRGRDYIFKKGDDIVCKANGVKIGEYRDSCRQLNETLHIYEADICPERISLFLSSLGYQFNFVDFPEMYLVSLSAPALLDLGVRRGMAGAHASQSFNLHSGYKPGVVKVAIGDEKRKGPLHYFELRWLQDDEVVASGRAGVLSFGDLENKVD